MKLNKKNLSIILTLSVASIVTFAVSVGQDIELSKYLNGRGGPNFRSAARNVQALLATGTRARIERVKSFTSGNSGLWVTVSSGPQNGKKMWIWFNKSSPGMKLVNADGTTTEIPAEGVKVRTTRPIVATPGGPPAPAPAPTPAPAASPAATAPVQVIPTPPPVVAPGTSLPDLINGANVAVGGMSPGGNTGCRDCAGGAAGVAPVPAPVSPPVVAPVAGADVTQDADLAFFSAIDSEVNAPRGANAALIRAHKYSVLRMKLGVFALYCENHKYNRDLTDRTMDVDQARRASDPAAYYNRWNAYLNSTLRPLNTEAERAFGGANQMEGSPANTGYNNRAANQLLSAYSAIPGRTSRQYCASAERKFNALLNLSAQDFRSYVEMPDAQRQSYLRARAQ